MVGGFGENGRALVIVVGFGNFSTILYSAPNIGLAQETLMPPPHYGFEVYGFLKCQ